MHRKQNPFVFKCPKCGSTLGAGVEFAKPPAKPTRWHCLACWAHFTLKQVKDRRE